MRLHGLHVAAAVVIASNTFLLVKAARNRSGAPEAEVTLTECELRVDPPDSDNSFGLLHVQFENPVPRWSLWPPGELPALWFDEAKLREFGFDLSMPATADDAGRFYRRQGPRQAYIALELGGPRWEEWLRLRQPMVRSPAAVYSKDIPDSERDEIERRTRSRLVAIDASPDAAALRARYPDRSRVLILAGGVTVVFEHGDVRTKRPPRIRGAITGLARPALHVPQPYARLLRNAPLGCRWDLDGNLESRRVRIVEPRLRVTVRTGAHYEPWVERVEMAPVQ